MLETWDNSGFRIQGFGVEKIRVGEHGTGDGPSVNKTLKVQDNDEKNPFRFVFAHDTAPFYFYEINSDF